MFTLSWKAAPIFTPQNDEQKEVVGDYIGVQLVVHPAELWALLLQM